MAANKITEKSAIAVFLSPGVLADGGGIIIIGGKIVRIPPRGPLIEQLREVLNKIANAKEAR